MIRRILNVNGFEKIVTVDSSATLADVLRENLLSHRHQSGLRKGRMRGMLRYHERETYTFMHN